jgi:hypothetical protein
LITRDHERKSAYSTNYLIDVENAIIVDVSPTTVIRQAQVLAAKRMIERTAKNFTLHPSRFLGDSAYGSADMLGWLVDERGIKPHVTVFDKSARKDGSFAREDFNYDPAGDVYVCPDGKTLTTTGTRVNNGETLLYRASKVDCDACVLRRRCCPNTLARKVPRSIHEKARDMARAIANSWEGRTSPRLRKKCCSLTSSAFSNSTDCDYADPTAPVTSSSSPQPPRTSGN